MRLPGQRHRTLAPSTALGDHDIAAIDAACDELERGGYAPIDWTPALIPCVRGSWTIQSGGAYLQSAGAGNVAYWTFPVFGGDYIRTIGIALYVAGAAPLTATLERVSFPGGVATVASIALSTPTTIWTPKIFDLVDPTINRRRGIAVDEVDHYHRIKVVSGQSGDRFAAGATHVGRPQPLP